MKLVGKFEEANQARVEEAQLQAARDKHYQAHAHWEWWTAANGAAFHNTDQARVIGQVFALFVLTIAAAEVGVGLAIVLLIYRNSRSADLDDVHALKG